MSIRQLSRFASVGVLATLVHICIGTTLIGVGFEPLLANLAAFLGAFCFSYLGHRFYSFRSGKVGLRTSLGRYSVVAVTGFLVNTLLLAGLLGIFPNRAAYCLTASTAIAALVVYNLAKNWAFSIADSQNNLSKSAD